MQEEFLTREEEPSESDETVEEKKKKLSPSAPPRSVVGPSVRPVFPFHCISFRFFPSSFSWFLVFLFRFQPFK